VSLRRELAGHEVQDPRLVVDDQDPGSRLLHRLRPLHRDPLPALGPESLAPRAGGREVPPNPMTVLSWRGLAQGICRSRPDSPVMVLDLSRPAGATYSPDGPRLVTCARQGGAHAGKRIAPRTLGGS